MRDANERRAVRTGGTPIVLAYGNRQTFRHRTGDINILGSTTVTLPIQRARYTLNDGLPTEFYVEPDPPRQDEPSQHETASRLRLNAPGQFNIEIPADSRWLVEGLNTVRIEIEDAAGRQERERVDFSWDPDPIPLPLDLCDLSGFSSIQDLGQVVDGAFEIDHESNTIRTKSPVGWDALLVLGSPNRSQEATYDVTFGPWQPETVFAGTSEFFTRHEVQSPDLLIKPGYTSSGLVTIRPNGVGETWIMHGQLLTGHNWAWRRVSQFPAAVDPGTTYSVRHRVIIQGPVNWVQFKIWQKGAPEPESWLGESDTAALGRRFEPVECGSFGLFQYGGTPTAWSNIRVRAVEVDGSIAQAIERKTRPANIAAVRARDFASRVSRKVKRSSRELSLGLKRRGV